MENQHEEALFATSQQPITSLRLIFRMISLAIILLVSILLIRIFNDNHGVWPLVLLIMCWLFGILLLIGYRIVIGLRIYTDRLAIITPLSELGLKWDQIRMSQSNGRMDLYIKGVICPFIYCSWGMPKRDCEVISIINDRICR